MEKASIQLELNKKLQSLNMPGVKREVCVVMGDYFVFLFEPIDEPVICWFRCPYQVNLDGEVTTDLMNAEVIQKSIKSPRDSATDFIIHHQN